MLLPTNPIVDKGEVLLQLVWTFLTGLLELSRWDFRNSSHAFTENSYCMLIMRLLAGICYIIYIIWFSSLLLAVIRKCSFKFLWRSRENFRANSSWNEWWLDKDASGHSTSKHQLFYPHSIKLFYSDLSLPFIHPFLFCFQKKKKLQTVFYYSLNIWVAY